MPGARIHDMLTIVTGLAPATYVVLISQGQSSNAAGVDTALLVGAHLLSGIMFSPDLDIDSAIGNRWWIFYWIWRPYMWAVPHGDRLWSHGLVLAPLIRLLYFFAVVSLVYLAVVWVLGQVGIVVPDYHLQVIDFMRSLVINRTRDVVAFLVGFVTGNAVHSIADWVTKDID